MDSTQRQALGLVRIVIGCLIVIGVLDGGLYFTQYILQYTQFQHHRAPKPSLDIPRIIFDSIPIIIGLIILIKTRAVTEWLSDFLE